MTWSWVIARMIYGNQQVDQLLNSVEVSYWLGGVPYKECVI